VPSALACPCSFKGHWTAAEAAAALAEGLGPGTVQLPVADGGEGTLAALHAARGGEWREADVHDAFGRPRRARWLLLPDRTACVEAAEAIPLDPSRLDPDVASSRGLGELIEAVGQPRSLIVALGGTATMDAGVGLGLTELPAPTRVAVDTDARLVEAPRIFGPQKGVQDVEALERRFAALDLPDLPGGGAAGGLGAALAALGAQLVPGAALVLDELGFDPRGYDLVVTGEGVVDAGSRRGKATGEVARRCAEANVRCAVVAARVDEPLPGAEAWELGGRDLVELGRLLAQTLR
jgi:glycerate 2-kinase